MSNTVNLEFAGDATKLAKAAAKAEKSIGGVGDSANSAADDFKKSGQDSAGFTAKLGQLGAGVSGVSGAIDDAAGTLEAFNQVQNASREKSNAQKRALIAVQQAQEDLNQAVRDGSQAGIDGEQAQVDATQASLDAAKALKQYAADVKQYGVNSIEAKQDQIDLNQAHLDGKQAQEDAAQATRDASQANIDAKSAQIDLNEAQAAAKPPELSKWAADVQMYAPLLQGLVGVTGLVTAAQWAWNAAAAANPVTWVIIGIVALIAVIVLIATKTTWFQTAWRNSWKWITTAAKNSWEFIKKIPGWIGTAFKAVGNFIIAPFRDAFNMVSTAWNNTVGQLHWSVPDWVPGIGGNSIGVPHLPHFHSGGTVGGPPGSEQLAVLQAGETVSTRGGGGTTVVQLPRGAILSSDALIEALSRAVRGRGGNVQLVLGGRNGVA